MFLSRIEESTRTLVGRDADGWEERFNVNNTPSALSTGIQG